MGRSVVAVIDWRAGSALKDNVRFLEKAGLAGRVRPRDWRAGAARYRSLTVRADGSCELQSWTAATAAKRVAGAVSARKIDGVRDGERG